MKLPSDADLGVRPTPGVSSRIARYQTPDFSAVGRGTEALGRAVVEMGQTLDVMNQRLVASRRSAELADALGKATEEISVAELEARRDLDFVTVNDRFKTLSGEIQSKYSGAIHDPVVKETFKQRFEELSLSKRLNVMTASAAREQDYHRSQLDRSLEVYARSAATAANPAEREVVIGQARLAINEIATAGWISPSDAAGREQQLLAKVDEAVVIEDMRNDPATTALKLATAADYAQHLDPVQRERFVDAGIGQANAMRAQLLREEEARVRREADAALSDAYSLAASGKLTRAYVEGLKNKVSPTEFKGLLDIQKKQGQADEDNKRAFAQVQVMLYESPGEAARLAIRYHEQGLIKDATLASVLTSARSLERQEGPRSGYERSRSFITSVLKPSAMTMDPAPEARMGLAVKEFDDWVLSQKETPADADLEKKAQAVVKKYSLIDMQDLVRKTGVGMSSDPEVAIAQIMEAGKRLKSELETGRITKQEFDRRAADLNRQLQAAQRAKND